MSAAFAEGLSFFVPGIPTAFARAGRGMGARNTGKYATYTPKKQRGASGEIALVAAVAMRSTPIFRGPVHLSVTATFPVPKNYKLNNPPFWKISRPDLDNIVKLIADSLNGIIWHDDAQVVSVTAQKLYGDVPGILIEVRPL